MGISLAMDEGFAHLVWVNTNEDRQERTMLRKIIALGLILTAILFATPNLVSHKNQGITASAASVEPSYAATARSAAAKDGMSGTDSASVTCDQQGPSGWNCKVAGVCSRAGYCPYRDVRVTCATGGDCWGRVTGGQ